ncbi:MAG: BatA and WFA domain-containing protein [Methanimicrococcus sp.]|nr:BatA and WFA domain-containing protein [Methanimicrococcus sp.]
MAIADTLASFPFIFPLALLGLLSIIPLIILYMLLPKPFKISMPSVMFLVRTEESREKIYSSITKLVKDPLFIIQLFVLIMLALAAAGPYILSYDTHSDESTVIIIDASGSMQTNGRFEDAKRDAVRHLGQVNTIILASSVPIMVAENVSAAEAESIIRNLTPKAVTADIGSAMATGANALSAKGGVMYVFSDFTSWDGISPMEAKNLLGSGLDINLMPYGTPTDNNLAIVNGYLEKSNGTYNYHFMVRNYANSPRTVTANVTTTAPNGTQMPFRPMTLVVPGNGAETFVLNNVQSGTTEIRMIVNDSLAEDNAAYISIPNSQAARALYISDPDVSGKLPSQIALELIPGLTLTSVVEVPEFISADYHFVVVNMGVHVLEAAETDALHAYVMNGGNVVFIAGEYLEAANQTVNLSRMLPARIDTTVEMLAGKQIYAIGGDLTSDLDLNDVYVKKYLNAEIRNATTTIYPVMTMEGVPIVAYGPYGNGTVFYFGLNDHAGDDAWNNFASFPEFPVFWIRIANYFTGIGDISEYNVRAGTIMALSENMEIITPEGRIITNRVLFDKAGIYTVGQKKIAVNMYNDKESNTLLQRQAGIESDGNGADGPQTLYEIKNNYFYIFAILAALLIFAELYLLRKRREI